MAKYIITIDTDRNCTEFMDYLFSFITGFEIESSLSSFYIECPFRNTTYDKWWYDYLEYYSYNTLSLFDHHLCKNNLHAHSIGIRTQKRPPDEVILDIVEKASLFFSAHAGLNQHVNKKRYWLGHDYSDVNFLGVRLLMGSKEKLINDYIIYSLNGELM